MPICPRAKHKLHRGHGPSSLSARGFAFASAYCWLAHPLVQDQQIRSLRENSLLWELNRELEQELKEIHAVLAE